MSSQRCKKPSWIVVVICIAMLTTFVRADSDAAATKHVYDMATPSIVAVQYVLETELNRVVKVGQGVVVREDGLVMLPMAAVDDRYPDEQMKGFKVIVPKADGASAEFSATFQGRDERYKVAFVATTSPQKWPAIKFESVKPNVGEPIYSVGLMPALMGYQPYVMNGKISGYAQSDVTRVLVNSEGLAATGSPVFNVNGKAIGFVNYQPPFPLYLNDKDSMMALISPPKFFVPSEEFVGAIAEPPTVGRAVPAAWAGLPELSGIFDEEAERLGLLGQPAIRIRGVVAGSPADKVGLKQDDIILKVDGHPLERGGNPQDSALILQRKILCQTPGSIMTFSILDTQGNTSRDVSMTLDPQPKPVSRARRFWASDVGFGVRELVPYDYYSMKLKPDITGLLITVVKPSSAASECRLQIGDLLTAFNRQATTGVAEFESTYAEFRKQNPTKSFDLVVTRDGREEKFSCTPR